MAADDAGEGGDAPSQRVDFPVIGSHCASLVRVGMFSDGIAPVARGRFGAWVRSRLATMESSGFQMPDDLK